MCIRDSFNGSASGVGGILRDIFTMGARPIATLDSIRFGEIKTDKTKYLLNGVVHGIGHYGNCIGIPNIGGECEFDKTYDYNNLVNAMAVGLAKKNKIYFSIMPEGLIQVFSDQELIDLISYLEGNEQVPLP